MAKLATEERRADVRVTNDGTVSLFELISLDSREWVDDNVEAESYQFLGHNLVVEHRYVSDLIVGMANDGLEVEVG
jgi:hypothetical protein